MKEQEGRMFSLDDVIQAYMTSTIDTGQDTLSEWIERYPEYEEDLREYAAHWRLLEQLPSRGYTEDEENSLVARATSVVQGILYSQRQRIRDADSEALSGLIDEAEKHNMSLDQFSESIEMSPAIITMLDNRQVQYSSIPSKAVENIAKALTTMTSIVSSYLRGEIQLAPAHYRSDRQPTTSGLFEFAYLVSIDPDLSDEQKTEWLGLASSAKDVRVENGEHLR